MYGLHAFMAQRALDNDQFGAGLRFRAKAYKSHPAGFSDPTTFEFVVRFLARLVGLKRSDSGNAAWGLKFSFEEFQAMQRPNTNALAPRYCGDKCIRCLVSGRFDVSNEP